MDGYYRETKYYSNTTFIVPVDLNCLVYHLELSIARAYKLQGNAAKQRVYEQKALLRKKAILKYCWSGQEEWFMDYNWKLKHITPFKTLAGVYPLEFQIADAKQASKVSAMVKKDFFEARRTGYHAEKVRAAMG